MFEYFFRFVSNHFPKRRNGAARQSYFFLEEHLKRSMMTSFLASIREA